MPLTRTYFLVLLEDPEHPEAEPVEHRVEIRAVDQLTAESEAKGMGLGAPQNMPITVTYLWAWAALRRTGVFEGRFRDFRNAVIAAEKEDPDEAEPVDPTRRDPSAELPLRSVGTSQANPLTGG